MSGECAHIGCTDDSWRDQAACINKDPKHFFPERGESTREAKDTCRGCVVREPCLAYAMALGHDLKGIWGGTSERQRREMRRARKADAA